MRRKGACDWSQEIDDDPGEAGKVATNYTTKTNGWIDEGKEGKKDLQEEFHTEKEESNNSGECEEQTEVDSAVYEKQTEAGSAVC